MQSQPSSKLVSSPSFVHNANTGHFSILYFNARSLLPKIDYLRLLCTMYKPDCVCIVESWLSSDILDSELCIDGYDIIRLDRNRHGGGVLLFINSVYSHCIVYTGRPELELVIVSVRLFSVSLSIALFYRPPGSPFVILDNLLTALCTHVSPTLLTNFILLGDFNINYLDVTHPLFLKLLSVSNSLTLTQVVSDPTHYSSNSSSLIDLVFLSSPKSFLFCNTLPPLANSDHLGLSFAVTIDKPRPNPTRSMRKIWRYAYADFDLANEMLSAIDWSTLLSSEDVNTCWSNWRTKFLQVMEASIPQAVLKARKNLPWLTKTAIQSMRKRNLLFKTAKKSNSPSDWEKYQCVRNKVVAMLRRDKRQYFYNLRFATNKQFWKAIKVINKQDTSIPALWDGHTSATSNIAKAELLNSYFYECFNHTSPSLNNPDPLDPKSCPINILCTEEQVIEMLCSLETTKSTGLDGVSAIMLRQTASSIAPCLAKLFNLSIATGSFPCEWKCARVTPIFKSTDSSLPQNYHPISILPIVSKILEQHIHSLVFKHLADNSPISKFQWGFMPRRSAISALCSLTHDWLRDLDNGNDVCSVFFDLRKAFDSVPHNHLLDKLATLSLCPHLLQWIHSYLSNRSQVVAVGGELSTIKNVLSGVPQGSVLGPLLFTVYIDDVADRISHSSSISLYADDIALYRSIRSPADYSILQSDITAIVACVEEEKHLNLNVSKCSFMLISRKRSHSVVSPLLIKSNTALEQVHRVKYLGVLLTSDLTWTEHIRRICNKTRRLIGLMYRRFHHCHPDLMLKLYKAFIRPHLEYAPQVWDPYLIKDIELVERTQKFALRVCCKNWTASYPDLLDSCQVSTLSNRRKIARLCHIYKIIYGLADCQMAPITRRVLNYSSRRSKPVQLQTLFAQTSHFQFSFFPLSMEQPSLRH